MRTKAFIPMLVLVGMLAAALVYLAPAQVGAKAPAWSNGLALTPPMGWNSWNRFGCDINDALIRETADAMVSSGMQAASYQYIIIDDCWSAPTRDSNGNLQPHPTKFPDGIKAVADYIHSRGLKFGIYADRGTTTCSGYPGSYGYETRDANTFASWGVDYVKYDNCAPVGDMQTDYTNMHNALAATNRDIVFSICTWWMAGTWMVDVGHLWRTTSDISDNWSSVASIIDTNNNTAQYAGPGHWNDPDMLEVGNGGMNDIEYRAHFSMWAIMAAPLIAGNDLRTMSQVTRDILTAPEVIAVDQDPLGVQGVKAKDNGSGLQVWSKPLSDSSAPGSLTRAVALLNRSGAAANITVNWSDIGLASGSAAVRNLWARADLGSFNNSYTANVPSHGVVLLKISGGSGPTTWTPTFTRTPVTLTPTFTGTPVTPTRTPTPTATGTGACIASILQAEAASFGGGATADSNNAGFLGTGFINFPSSGGYVQFNNVNGGSGGSAALRIRYALGAGSSRTGQLTINGSSQNISFTTTGSWASWAVREMTISLNAGASNTIRFQSTGQDLANIDQIEVGACGGVTATLTPTQTQGPTLTPTHTPTLGPTSTPSRTPSPMPTGNGGSTCSPVNATFTAPFTFNGAGTFCWQSSSLGTFVNSWNLSSLTINGVNFTNTYVPSGAYPAPIDGYWYIRYTGNYPWSHFEAK